MHIGVWCGRRMNASESQFILTCVHLQDLSIFLLDFHLINKEEKIKVRISGSILEGIPTLCIGGIQYCFSAVVSLWVWSHGNSHRECPNSPWQLRRLTAPTEHLILVLRHYSQVSAYSQTRTWFWIVETARPDQLSRSMRLHWMWPAWVRVHLSCMCVVTRETWNNQSNQ